MLVGGYATGAVVVAAARFPVLTIASSVWRSSIVKLTIYFVCHVSTWMKTGSSLPLSPVIIFLTEH